MASKYSERKGKNITAFWKCFAIFLYSALFLFGLAAVIPLGSVNKIFSSSCPLWAKINAVKQPNGTFNVIIYGPESSVWGHNHDCNFCMYTAVCSSIYAFIWAWFYILCGRGGYSTNGLPKPWRIVCPSCIFSLTFTIVILVASIYLTEGFASMCKYLEKNPHIESCAAASQYKWTGLLKPKGFYTDLTIAETMMWCSTGAWIITTVSLILRCCLPADFIVSDKDSEDKEFYQFLGEEELFTSENVKET